MTEPLTVIDPAGASVTLRSGDALFNNLTDIMGKLRIFYIFTHRIIFVAFFVYLYLSKEI